MAWPVTDMLNGAVRKSRIAAARSCSRIVKLILTATRIPNVFGCSQTVSPCRRQVVRLKTQNGAASKCGAVCSNFTHSLMPLARRGLYSTAPQIRPTSACASCNQHGLDPVEGREEALQDFDLRLLMGGDVRLHGIVVHVVLVVVLRRIEGLPELNRRRDC